MELDRRYLDGRNGQFARTGKTGVVLQLIAVGGALIAAPAFFRALTPVVVTVVEVLLAIGHVCMTYLRANGF